MSAANAAPKNVVNANATTIIPDVNNPAFIRMIHLSLEFCRKTMSRFNLEVNLK